MNTLHEVQYVNCYYLSNEDDELLALAHVIVLGVMGSIHIKLLSCASGVSEDWAFSSIVEHLTVQYPNFKFRFAKDTA